MDRPSAANADFLGFGRISVSATAPFLGSVLAPASGLPWVLRMAGVGVVAGFAFLGTLLDF